MNRSGWVVIGVVAVAVVVSFVFALAAWLPDSDDDKAGPEQAVRDYLQLIADGKADEANEAVPLSRTPVEGDDTFLTDETLGAAKSRIRVVDVRTQSVSDGDARVLAEYSVGLESVQVYFHAERIGEKWRLLDTLATPVNVQSSMSTLDHAYIGDTEVLVARQSLGIDDADRILLYPGEYDVRGMDTDYLSTPAETVAVFDDDLSTHIKPVLAKLHYVPEDSLRTAVNDSVANLVRRCVATPPDTDDKCWQLVSDQLRLPGYKLELIDMPSVGELDDTGWTFSSSRGMVRVTQRDGSVTNWTFEIQGDVSVDPDNRVTVTYPT